MKNKRKIKFNKDKQKIKNSKSKNKNKNVNEDKEISENKNIEQSPISINKLITCNRRNNNWKEGFRGSYRWIN